VTAIVDGFAYRMQDLLEEVFPPDGSPGQFQNVAQVHSTGVEFELSAKLPREVEVLASDVVQRAVDPTTGLVLANSPHTLAKLRAGLPVMAHRAFVSSSIQYMSAKGTDAGATVTPVFTQNITLSTKLPLRCGLDLQAGVLNLWNRIYYDPAGLAVDTMREDGRSFFLKLTWLHSGGSAQ
jgi:outer membrane receptor protein involved in Fe transport